MNDFNEDLKRSHEAEDLPLWKEIYIKAFPTMQEIINHRQDGWHQRAGIDRSIILSDSRQIFIDEKVRYRNKNTGKVYPDILLEYLSNDKTGSLGWVCKPIRSDYIAYAIAPLGKCCLLPVIQLQSAWKENEIKWKSQYRDLPAVNKGYVTHSIAVPVRVLFQEIGNCLRINFDRFEECIN